MLSAPISLGNPRGSNWGGGGGGVRGDPTNPNTKTPLWVVYGDNVFSGNTGQITHDMQARQAQKSKPDSFHNEQGDNRGLVL